MKMTRIMLIIKLFALLALSSPYFSSTAYAQSSRVKFDVHVLVNGLNHPWSMVFLPDGQILLTERIGQLRIVSTDGKLSAPIKGVPAVFAKDQGGLLGLALDPDFSKNHLIYFSYAESQADKAGTVVARAKLVDMALENLQVIFRQQPKTDGNKHFGSRLVFAPDGNLFVTLGERFKYMDKAQQLDNHLGKLVRIRSDGSVPSDNPFVRDSQAKPEIWSYGHRHIQGAAIHPGTGELWIHEHGPRGGDEINIPKPGKNYGWPLASYGIHYWMVPIKKEHAERGFEEPIYYWTPSIAPSGMMFYQGNMFPEWKGNLFVGALAGKHLVRLVVNEKNIMSEENLLKDSARIRDVAAGPDGAIYLLTDEENGKLLRLTRATAP
jgi:glucose/arabinose dehydrogenase